MKTIKYFQIGVGLLLWLLIVWILPVGYIERLVTFSFFVTVPLFLFVTERRQRENEIQLFHWIILLLLPMALSGSLSFLFPPGVLAGVFSLGWLLVTCLIGLYGFLRLLERGFYLLEEFCIDIGYVYLPLGGFWFAAHRFGIDIGNFGSVLILLTVAHFHFSSLSAPIFTGLSGRMLKKTRIFKMIAVFNMLSPLLIAVGITFSRTFEMVTVLLFVVSLLMYIYYSIYLALKVIKSIYARIFLLISSFTLIVTLGFAAFYGIGRGLGIHTVSISTMVLVHGIGNTFGFVLFGILAWAIIQPKSRATMNRFPHSHMKGAWRIGSDFLERKQWIDSSNDKILGLVDDFSVYRNEVFNPLIIHPNIREFYENTMDYELLALTKWQRGFVLLSHMYKQISKRIEQINLPLNNEFCLHEGRIVPVNSEQDGRQNVRAWMRWDKVSKKIIFVAVYSQHTSENKTYMNIALPLPFGNMTGILRLNHDKDDGLILTSIPHVEQIGDEGIYFFLGNIRIRLPLNESFHIRVNQNKINATHTMWMFGIPFLNIEYKITKNESYKNIECVRNLI
ncbi:membrane protein [Heyndrickxia sporothermodurans]|nr:membrane protein [Heyndrickxia sporothermodurans]